MQRFADFTKEQIIKGNTAGANRCLQKAEDIYRSGSLHIKNLVANVYVYSVSTFLELHNYNIQNLFPEALFGEYKTQINASSL